MRRSRCSEPEVGNDVTGKTIHSLKGIQAHSRVTRCSCQGRQRSASENVRDGQGGPLLREFTVEENGLVGS